MKKRNNNYVDTTRRMFLANSAAVVAAVGTSSNVLASAVPEIQSSRIPKEISASSARSMHMYLFQENLRYDKLAEGLGARSEYVQTPEQLREALKRSYQAAAKESLSTVINVQALKEFTSARHYPPGVALNPEPGVGAFAH